MSLAIIALIGAWYAFCAAVAVRKRWYGLALLFTGVACFAGFAFGFIAV